LRNGMLKWMSEPANAWVKNVLGFRHKHARTGQGPAEWKLACAALNLLTMAKMMRA
jgi:hypothetical protein